MSITTIELPLFQKSFWVNFIAICCLSVISLNATFAQTFVLNQNFNGGIPSLWDNIDNDGQPLNAAVNFLGSSWGVISDPDSIGIGDSCIAATSWFSPPATADNWIISPKFAITTNNILRWDAKTPDKDYRDGYQVYVSASNKLLSTFLTSTPIFDTAAEDTAWVRHELNLMSAGYSNQQIYIAFRHNATDKFMLMLDNISVGQPPTGLEEIVDETTGMSLDGEDVGLEEELMGEPDLEDIEAKKSKLFYLSYLDV